MCILCTQILKSKIHSKFKTEAGETSSEKENDSQLKGMYVATYTPYAVWCSIVLQCL